jgi:hypothetical protein
MRIFTKAKIEPDLKLWDMVNEPPPPRARPDAGRPMELQGPGEALCAA